MSRLSIRGLAISAALACTALAGALPAPAQANPIEKVLSTPTPWLYYYGVTPSTMNSILSSGNYRIVDLQAESASSSGPVFTVALVANSGVYGKGWWWYYGQSISQVSSALSTNNARLISIAPYVVNGTTYFASVMVPNTGADAKSWYWWVGSASTIQSDLASSGARLVDLEPYVNGTGTTYAAIAIANTGADADSWYWYLNSSSSSLYTNVVNNKQQLLSLANEPGSTGLDAAMEGNPTAAWWYYTGISPTLLNQEIFENGARLTQVRSTFPNNVRTMNAIMINNSNACTSRLIGIAHANGTGWNGHYVKQISGKVIDGGPVLCAANDSRPFEPASAIKVVIGAYAMNMVQNKQAKLTDAVPVLDPNNFCNFVQTGTESLGNAITQMLQNSDNARTDMLLKRYGLANLTAYAHAEGLPNTAFNSYVDCAGPHNTFTLDDAGTLYTELAEHTILNKTNVTKLFSMMAGRNYDFAGMWSDMQPIISQEAPAHITSDELNAFIAGITLTYKSGGYIWPGGIADLNGQTEYGDVGIDGVISLPYCASKTKVSARQFVFGFWHESTSSDSDQTPVFNATGAGAELLREQIQTSLATWKKCSAG